MVNIFKYLAEFGKSYGSETIQMFDGKNPEFGDREFKMT